MSNPNSGFKRRNYLINPGFQLKMVAYALTGAGLIAGLMGSLFFVFFHRFESIGRSVGLPEGHAYFQFISQQRGFMGVAMLVVCLVVFIVMTVGGILISHRIAGPLYKLTKHLERLTSEKKLEGVKFRAKDFFPEVADRFNDFINSINK